MSLDSQPRMPNRIDPVESPEQKASKQLNATLAQLDAQFGAEDVNQALQVIFVGDETLTAAPKSLSYLKWKLDVLNTEIGEDTVTTALYQIDKQRNPPIEQTPEPQPSPERIAQSHQYIGEILSLLDSLEDKNPAAYEIWGGDEERYHYDEFPVYGTEDEVAHLRTALDRLQRYFATATGEALSPEDMTSKMKEILADA